MFKSRKSYYKLLHEARITWQKSEQFNPRQDQTIIAKKNREIAELLEKNREEIEAGNLVVYIIDECHLLWNNLCGYLWNFITEPVKIPILNPKERQTYYGALNLLTREFILIPYPQGDGESTVSFIEQLQKRNPEARILLIWDGATYHRGEKMKEFLAEQNQGLSKAVFPLRGSASYIRRKPPNYALPMPHSRFPIPDSLFQPIVFSRIKSPRYSSFHGGKL